MVVGYNKLHTELIYKLRFIDGGNAVVDRDYKPCAIVVQFAYRVFIQSVTLFAGWYVPLYICADSVKVSVQHNGRCNAVTVIVAVNGYLYLVIDRFLDCLYCLIHISYKQWVGKLSTVEVLLCLIGCVYPSSDKQTAKQHRQTGIGLKLHRKCIVRISDKPFFHKKSYPLDKFSQLV